MAKHHFLMELKLMAAATLFGRLAVLHTLKTIIENNNLTMISS